MNWYLKKRIGQLYGTQSDFARRIENSDSVVSRVICGRRRLQAEEARRWAEALELQEEDIVRSQE